MNIRQRTKVLISSLLFGATLNLVLFAHGLAAPQTPCSTGSDCQSAGYGVAHLMPANTSDPYSLFYQGPDAPFNQNIGTLIYSLLDPTSAAPALALFNVATTLGANKYTFTTLADFTNQDLKRLLTDNQVTASINTENMAMLPGPLLLSPNQISLANLPGKTQIPYSTSTANMNVNTLLLPLQYNSSQQQSAWNFIQYLSIMAQHDPALDLSQLSNNDLASIFTSNSDFQNYLVSLRSQAAAQSIGLSNLYYIYSSRIPQSTASYTSMIPNLTKISALYPQASPAQIENYLATRRYRDPNWSTMVQTTANSAELQRQTVYLLRDLLYEEYQHKLVDERILTTLSAMQLSGNTEQATKIKGLYQKLKNQPPFNGTHTGP